MNKRGIGETIFFSSSEIQVKWYSFRRKFTECGTTWKHQKDEQKRITPTFIYLLSQVNIWHLGFFLDFYFQSRLLCPYTNIQWKSRSLVLTRTWLMRKSPNRNRTKVKVSFFIHVGGCVIVMRSWHTVQLNNFSISTWQKIMEIFDCCNSAKCALAFVGNLERIALSLKLTSSFRFIEKKTCFHYNWNDFGEICLNSWLKIWNFTYFYMQRPNKY